MKIRFDEKRIVSSRTQWTSLCSREVEMDVCKRRILRVKNEIRKPVTSVYGK